MLNKLFKDSKLSIISCNTASEYDNTFQSYLSYSFDENTIIFTDNISLLRNKYKYKKIFLINNWNSIRDKLNLFQKLCFL